MSASNSTQEVIVWWLSFNYEYPNFLATLKSDYDYRLVIRLDDSTVTPQLPGPYLNMELVSRIPQPFITDHGRHPASHMTNNYLASSQSANPEIRSS